MSKARRYITAGGTLLCALGIGYFMQSGATLPGPDAAPGAQAVDAAPKDADFAQRSDGEAVEISAATLTSAVPVPPVAAPQPQALPGLPEASPTPAAFDMQTPGEMPREEPVPSFECEQSLSARPVAAAMVELTLDAACLPNARFTLHHNGMMFTGVTDAAGKSLLTVPALSEQAVFIAAFPGGDGAVASAEVTSMQDYDRVVLQWQRHGGLQLHALEHGADYGDPGHVWAGASRDMAVAARGEGGFLMRLGAGDMPEALLAEVYTFPTGTSPQEGAVVVSLEAQVTRENCGRDIVAQTIEVKGAQRPKVQDVELAMPECDAVGDFLVLKNLIDDLKIARN